MKQNLNAFQVEIDLEPGLLDQFPNFRDVVKASVYSCGRAFKSIAADLDMSVSELSRKLTDNPNDPIHFPLHRLPDLIRATSDLRPLYWLIETFLEDQDSKRKRAINDLAKLMPQLQQVLKAAQQLGTTDSELKAVK